ncbi:hypothetical protein BV20DRAFT_678778 [Pilatotrama ljubarskyi]|nr:hypothetical protein BV20DRAFT_678778 [Pilatotrama ljubarskyi]
MPSLCSRSTRARVAAGTDMVGARDGCRWAGGVTVLSFGHLVSTHNPISGVLHLVYRAIGSYSALRLLQSLRGGRPNLP